MIMYNIKLFSSAGYKRQLESMRDVVFCSVTGLCALSFFVSPPRSSYFSLGNWMNMGLLTRPAQEMWHDKPVTFRGIAPEDAYNQSGENVIECGTTSR